MSLIELFILAVGLSMDAFAVAICKGLAMKKMSWKNAVIVGLYFGGFQALMPLIGYLLGSQFRDSITKFDHWIAFLLLAIIGISMIKESLDAPIDSCELVDPGLDVKTMVTMAIATSIDALAVGVTFAFLTVSITPAIIFIGITTLILSISGVKIGNLFGCRYKSKAELIGGIILIIIGIKILIEHLFLS